MGRAIVREPRVFLMDEPLSNLDAKLRVATRAEIAALQRNLGVTTLYVTHDQVEAMTMGDRVAVMRHGVLQQVGTPRSLYDDPVNAFVAGFIGSPAMNLLEGVVVEDGVRLGVAAAPVFAPPAPVGTKLTVGIRPESLAPAPGGEGIPATVTLVEELGAEAFVHLRVETDAGSDIKAAGHVIARFEPRTAPAIGQLVPLRIKEGAMLFFDPVTGERLAQ